MLSDIVIFLLSCILIYLLYNLIYPTIEKYKSEQKEDYTPGTDYTCRSSPSTCPTGSYCPSSGLSSPVACPAGSYCSTSGMTGPTSCTIGSYCPTTGLTAAMPCPAGSYCPTAGISSLNLTRTCPAGSYCPTAGLSSATACPVGYYCPSTGASSATSCPVGYYCPSTGASTTTICPVGYYCSSTGMSAPTICPIGSYCPNTGMTGPIVCPPGTLCLTTGLTSPVDCPTGYYCTSPNVAAIICPIGSYCPNNCLTAAVPLSVIDISTSLSVGSVTFTSQDLSLLKQIIYQGAGLKNMNAGGILGGPSSTANQTSPTLNISNIPTTKTSDQLWSITKYGQSTSAINNVLTESDLQLLISSVTTGISIQNMNSRSFLGGTSTAAQQLSYSTTTAAGVTVPKLTLNLWGYGTNGAGADQTWTFVLNNLPAVGTNTLQVGSTTLSEANAYVLKSLVTSGVQIKNSNCSSSSVTSVLGGIPAPTQAVPLPYSPAPLNMYNNLGGADQTWVFVQ